MQRLVTKEYSDAARSASRRRSILLRLEFINTFVSNGTIRIGQCGTAEMVADLGTKLVAPQDAKKLKVLVGLSPTSDVVDKWKCADISWRRYVNP